MYSEINYYFSKLTFAFTTVFIIVGSSVIIYYALIFYPNAWKLSLLFASPLLVIVYILPKYFRTLIFLLTKRPALTLTKEKIIDNFKNEEYKWSDIKKIEYRVTEEFGARGFKYIAVDLNDSTEVKLYDVRLECKRSDFLDMLVDFHNKYK